MSPDITTNICQIWQTNQSKRVVMSKGWICCITPQVLPTSSVSPSHLVHVASLLSISHHWHRVGSAAAKVTDGQYPPLSCLWAGPSGLNYAAWDPSWAAMTGYGSVWHPCCFQGHFFLARGRRGQIRWSSCASSAVRHRSETWTGVIYYLPRGEEMNPSGSGLTG